MVRAGGRPVAEGAGQVVRTWSPCQPPRFPHLLHVHPTEVSRPATSCVLWTRASETSGSLGGDHCSTTLEYRSLKLCTWWRVTREPKDATIICICALKWVVQDIEGVKKVSTTPECNCFFFFFSTQEEYFLCNVGFIVGRMESFLPTYWDQQGRRKTIRCLWATSEGRCVRNPAFLVFPFVYVSMVHFSVSGPFVHWSFQWEAYRLSPDFYSSQWVR